MADILVRNISPETKHRLAVRAAQNGRSAQAEAKLIIEAAVDPKPGSWVRVLSEAACGAQENGFILPERHTAREITIE